MTTNAKLIGTTEACSELNISRATLTRWVQAGKIKPAIEGTGIRGPRFFYLSEVARVKRSLNRVAA